MSSIHSAPTRTERSLWVAGVLVGLVTTALVYCGISPDEANATKTRTEVPELDADVDANIPTERPPRGRAEPNENEARTSQIDHDRGEP